VAFYDIDCGRLPAARASLDRRRLGPDLRLTADFCRILRIDGAHERSNAPSMNRG
jgi:hypothetical protein